MLGEIPTHVGGDSRTASEGPWTIARPLTRPTRMQATGASAAIGHARCLIELPRTAGPRRERHRPRVVTASSTSLRARLADHYEHFSELRLASSVVAEVAKAVAAVTTPPTPLDPAFVTAVCRLVSAVSVAVT